LRNDAPPPPDTIELHNPTEQPAEVGGWWLTDDFNTPAKFRIPNGTSIAPLDYLTFDATQFGAGDAGFGLGADGDEVWLFSADAAGQLTGYVHGHRFGAADDGVSFGLHVTSDGQEHFVAQSAPTLGTANAGPQVGPVVISEIMYHPSGGDDGTDCSGDEYIEIVNISAEVVPLFAADRPTNTWRVRGGVDFDFPTDLTLAGGEYILLVNFNPTNTALTAAYRSKYTVDASVRLFGPFSGKLDNSGETIGLLKPAVSGADVVAHVLTDRIDYGDAAPWPGGADGSGQSLQRVDLGAFGNEPANWIAASPSAARRLIPTLVIQMQPSILLMAWEDSPVAWVLEEAAEITGPADWQSSAVQPVLSGGYWRVTVPRTATTSAFYRLRLNVEH